MADTHTRLQPSNATPFELLFDEANDGIVRVGPDFASLPFARANPPPPILPFLVWELGLGELTPYLPNLYDLIADGVRWQRVRGTPAAIRKGLGWIGYDFLAIGEETTRFRDFPDLGARRLRWSRMQLELDRVREADSPDLEQIAGIVGQSLPERSYFSRAFRGYDVRAGETSFQRTGYCLAGDHSGVFVGDIPTQWSFGRRYESTTTLGEAVLTELDTWIAPLPETYSDPWSTVDVLWTGINDLWSILDNAIRADTIADSLTSETAWIRFRDSDGAIIGHTRATLRKVSESVAGEYEIGAAKYRVVADGGESVIAHGRTRFGDNSGENAASMSVIFRGVLGAGAKPGALWLGPDAITGGVEVSATSIEIPFGLTVRERTLFLMRF
jgi:hypothetical protein